MFFFTFAISNRVTAFSSVPLCVYLDHNILRAETGAFYFSLYTASMTLIIITSTQFLGFTLFPNGNQKDNTNPT